MPQQSKELRKPKSVGNLAMQRLNKDSLHKKDPASRTAKKKQMKAERKFLPTIQQKQLLNQLFEKREILQRIRRNSRIKGRNETELGPKEYGIIDAILAVDVKDITKAFYQVYTKATTGPNAVAKALQILLLLQVATGGLAKPIKEEADSLIKQLKAQGTNIPDNSLESLRKAIINGPQDEMQLFVDKAKEIGVEQSDSEREIMSVVWSVESKHGSEKFKSRFGVGKDVEESEVAVGIPHELRHLMVGGHNDRDLRQITEQGIKASEQKTSELQEAVHLIRDSMSSILGKMSKEEIATIGQGIRDKMKKYYPNGGTVLENSLIKSIKETDSGPNTGEEAYYGDLALIRLAGIKYAERMIGISEDFKKGTWDRPWIKQSQLWGLIDHYHIYYTHFLPEEFLNIAVKYEPKLKPLQELVVSREKRFRRIIERNRFKTAKSSSTRIEL